MDSANEMAGCAGPSRRSGQGHGKRLHGVQMRMPRSSPPVLSRTAIAAAAIEQRECREMGWGMCEAIKAADMKLVNDGSLDDFQKNVEMLLGLLKAGTTSPDKVQM